MNVRQLRKSVLRTAAIELLNEFPEAIAEAEWLRARAEERPDYDEADS
ncbi:hypothetical protein [Arthrobacter sp. MDT1-65]